MSEGGLGDSIENSRASAATVVLIFCRAYLPGFRAGGPIQTLSNLVARLGDHFAFKIVTLDRDLGDARAYPEVNSNRWNSVGKADVLYLSPRDVSFRSLLRVIRTTTPDCIYLNSFFDPVFSLRVLVLRRLGLLGATTVILAPRGEFSQKALALKPHRKSLFTAASRIASLHRGVVFQGSSHREIEDISRALPFISSGALKIAPNLPVDSELGAGGEAEDPDGRSAGVLRVCFLARISPMKNLDFALECLAQLREEVKFTVYGPKEDAEYWGRCRAIADTLPANVSVHFAGEVLHSGVRSHLAKHDIFFLPTKGENYGHVILEALSAGLPVLISDRTPWRNLQAQGVGWDLPLDSKQSFTDVMASYARLTCEARKQLSNRAKEFANTKIRDPEAERANFALFRDATRGKVCGKRSRN